METWFISDTHFTHRNIIHFKDKNGEIIRKFDTVEEHDELLVENWNKLVSPKDRIYHLGDVVINRKALSILGRLNGRKKLIKGNHDIFKLQDYSPYFEDIAAYRHYPEHGIICSHIPVHPSQLEYRFKANVHGHLHQNIVTKNELTWRGMKKTPDERYINICVEHTDYKPIHFSEILEKINEH